MLVIRFGKVHTPASAARLVLDTPTHQVFPIFKILSHVTEKRKHRTISFSLRFNLLFPFFKIKKKILDEQFQPHLFFFTLIWCVCIFHTLTVAFSKSLLLLSSARNPSLYMLKCYWNFNDKLVTVITVSYIMVWEVFDKCTNISLRGLANSQ